MMVPKSLHRTNGWKSPNIHPFTKNKRGGILGLKRAEVFLENPGLRNVLKISSSWVVSNILYFHPYLGKIPNLTHMFQMGWYNHQPVFFFHGSRYWDCIQHGFGWVHTAALGAGTGHGTVFFGVWRLLLPSRGLEAKSMGDFWTARSMYVHVIMMIHFACFLVCFFGWEK